MQPPINVKTNKLVKITYLAGTIVKEPMSSEEITKALSSSPDHPAVLAAYQILETYTAVADTEANDEDNILKGTSTHYQMARSMFTNCLAEIRDRIEGNTP